MSNRLESRCFYYQRCLACRYFSPLDSSLAPFCLPLFTFANSSLSSASSLTCFGCARSPQLSLLFSGCWSLYADALNYSYICDAFSFRIQNTICSSLVMMLFLMVLRICFRLLYLASFLRMSLATESAY